LTTEYAVLMTNIRFIRIEQNILKNYCTYIQKHNSTFKAGGRFVREGVAPVIRYASVYNKIIFINVFTNTPQPKLKKKKEINAPIKCFHHKSDIYFRLLLHSADLTYQGRNLFFLVFSLYFSK